MSSRTVQIIGGPEDVRAHAHVDPATNALKVTPIGGSGGSTEVTQDTHDDLNANANIQVGDTDVSSGNPVPISDAGGSITVDGSVSISGSTGPLEVEQDTHDDLNCNANMQIGDADVGALNPVPISDNGSSITVDGTVAVSSVSGTVTIGQPVAVTDNGGSLTVDGTVSVGNFPTEQEVVQPMHDDLNANANMQVGNVDVANGNPVPVSDAGGSLTVDGTVSVSGAVEVEQSAHDDLNANANIQVGNVDVGGANPVPVSDAGGSLTVDGTVSVSGDVEVVQPTHDDLNANANLQVGNVDASAANPVPVEPGTGAVFPVSDNGGSLTVDGTVSVSGTVDVDIVAQTSPLSVTVQEPLSVDDNGGSLTVDQATHDNLNANANMQVGDADVANGNPVPVSDAGGTLSVDDGGGSLTVDFASEHDEDSSHTTGHKGVFALAVRNDNAATAMAGANGDYSGISVDDKGRLFVRQMERRIKLTGSTSGKPIEINNTATPGDVIDVTAGLNAGEGYSYTLRASFVTQAASEEDCTLTLEFGGVAATEILTFVIPIEDTITLVAGETLEANGLTVAAFVGTAGQRVNITGYKELVAT